MLQHLRTTISSLMLVTSAICWAGEKTEAAIGGGVGGAAGAAIGHELGGREGAIVGGALGAVVGTAIATGDGEKSGDSSGSGSGPILVQDAPPPHGHAHGRHCPPGQAKKGRC